MLWRGAARMPPLAHLWLHVHIEFPSLRFFSNSDRVLSFGSSCPRQPDFHPSLLEQRSADGTFLTRHTGLTLPPPFLLRIPVRLLVDFFRSCISLLACAARSG